MTGAEALRRAAQDPQTVARPVAWQGTAQGLNYNRDECGWVHIHAAANPGTLAYAFKSVPAAQEGDDRHTVGTAPKGRKVRPLGLPKANGVAKLASVQNGLLAEWEVVARGTLEAEGERLVSEKRYYPTLSLHAPVPAPVDLKRQNQKAGR